MYAQQKNYGKKQDPSKKCYELDVCTNSQYGPGCVLKVDGTDEQLESAAS